jgi:hypothetical protein
MSDQGELVADEFVRDLTQIQDEAVGYLDMHPDGKRKCLDHLGHTIKTLKKIENDLLKASNDEISSAKMVQVLWTGARDVTFTKELFVSAFAHVWRKESPKIDSVEMQDNYELDTQKQLTPIRMCFIRFSTEEDAYSALGYERLQVNKVRSSNDGLHCMNIKFISPVTPQPMHATLRRVGGLIKRLNDIDLELKQIGATREGGCVPTLSKAFVDKAWFVSALEKAKKARAPGISLDHHSYAPLMLMKPVDTALLNAKIKKLYDEECDIVIELREHQLKGLDFNFKHPSI